MVLFLLSSHIHHHKPRGASTPGRDWMRWEMETGEIETAMEKIWDLHDKLSDAIHSVSRDHFFRSVRTPGRRAESVKAVETGGGGSGGFVFVKGFRSGRELEDEKEIAEARSLNGIRTALENLEDQLEFLHTVQSQQQAEKDAAIARLEQSRIILAMKLADHHGKKYKVLEEALAFVGNVQDEGRFVEADKLFNRSRCHSANNLQVQNGSRLNIFKRIFFSGLMLVKRSFSLGMGGGLPGNAALFAISMLAVFQLHQAASRGVLLLKAPEVPERFPSRRSVGDNEIKHLDVFSARG